MQDKTPFSRKVSAEYIESANHDIIIQQLTVVVNNYF